MNPIPMILADLRGLRWIGVVIVALVAIAVAVGIALGAQERAFRHASAAAADDFPLVVGAAGSPTSLVLSTVYLRLEALPLLRGEVLRRAQTDDRIAAVAPIAFGDVVRGHPVVGTTADFATRWGRLATTEGRMFVEEGEAVVGAAARIAVGETFSPSHGRAGSHARPGEADPEEKTHVHGAVHYTVVGRMAPTGGPWDRAVIVPVESVWETHGLGNGHRADGRIGAPFDAEGLPGLPALVVKPKSFASAYQLRAEYRAEGLGALFPAEVLVDLYAVIGDVGRILMVASAIDDGLVFLAVTALLVTVGGLRRRRYALLRALGASRVFVLSTVWGSSALLTAIGCLLGLGLGRAAAGIVSHLLTTETGLAVPVRLEAPDFVWVGFVFLAGSLFALVPALLAGRGRIVDGLSA